MGLLTTYIAYALGKRAASRNADLERWIEFGDEDECSECGHPESRHDDDGACPSY